MIIDRLLEQAGWTFDVEEYAPGSERSGFADYKLFDRAGTAIALLEAKPAESDALVGKEQAREYANSLGIPLVMLSNGREHYVWDTRAGNPKRALSIPSPEAVASVSSRPPVDRELLWTTETGKSYLRRKAEGDRDLRQYQADAIAAVQRGAEEGETAFLLEMATGTGKTTVAAALCFLYLNTGNARRILFLVDRIELRQQAALDIRSAINDQYTVAAYEGNDNHDWNNTRITVATIQSLEALHQHGVPIPADHFDLIVADEAHRCISGPNHRRLFEMFQAEKIGLTATPRTFVTNDPVGDDDKSAAAREQRAIRDTYLAFGLNPGKPTYSYTIEQGAKDGYLVLPTAVDVRTEVTEALMSEEGYEVTIADYESDEGEQQFTYHIGDFARSFLSQGTNVEFARVYLAEALREPGTELIGKGIIYAVSQRHAAMLTQALNEVAGETWPGVYQSDFAVQITSDVRHANDYGEKFKNNALNGQHPAVPGYQTAKTRVCVTVAMMTTGYDCPDLLNIVVCRPIKSPTDFTQIKGRGTRRYDFRENYTDPVVRQRMEPQPKQRFRIIDYFAVCEYHHEGHYYEPRIPIPPEPKPDDDGGGNGEPPPPPRGAYIRHGEDEATSLTRLTFQSDARRIAGRTEDVRYTLRQEQEASNRTIADAFEQYLIENPVSDEAALENVRAVFEAYAADDDVRRIIDSKDFGALEGTVLEFERYRDTPAEHRQAIPGYVREYLLKDEQAA